MSACPQAPVRVRSAWCSRCGSYDCRSCSLTVWRQGWQNVQWRHTVDQAWGLWWAHSYPLTYLCFSSENRSKSDRDQAFDWVSEPSFCFLGFCLCFAFTNYSSSFTFCIFVGRTSSQLSFHSWSHPVPSGGGWERLRILSRQEAKGNKFLTSKRGFCSGTRVLETRLCKDGDILEHIRNEGWRTHILKIFPNCEEIDFSQTASPWGSLFKGRGKDMIYRKEELELILPRPELWVQKRNEKEKDWVRYQGSCSHTSIPRDYQKHPDRQGQPQTSRLLACLPRCLKGRLQSSERNLALGYFQNGMEGLAKGWQWEGRQEITPQS